MSNPRYSWWGYVKDMIRKYPGRQGKKLTGTALREFRAVQAAIEETERKEDGQARLAVVDLVLWQGKRSISGAALEIPCSERTAQQWHADFIREVARNFRCNGLL